MKNQNQDGVDWSISWHVNYNTNKSVIYTVISLAKYNFRYLVAYGAYEIISSFVPVQQVHKGD